MHDQLELNCCGQLMWRPRQHITLLVLCKKRERQTSPSAAEHRSAMVSSPADRATSCSCAHMASVSGVRSRPSSRVMASANLQSSSAVTKPMRAWEGDI